MKKLLLFLTALFPLTMSVQIFDSPYCWFDNSAGHFRDITERYVIPGMQPFSLYVVDEAHLMPGMGGGAQSYNAANHEAGAMVYVLPGKQLEHLKQMERMFVQPIYDSLVAFTKESEEMRGKGGGQFFLFPAGAAEKMFIRGKEETVTFMGVKDAKHTDYTIDFGKSPMYLSLFNAALQMRFHMYRYYDPTADKSALVIFMQAGLDREYKDIDDEVQAMAALLGSLSSTLILGNPANSKALKDWIRHSTWKDIQPDFERYFHLKAAAQTTHEPPVPPELDFPNDSTIIVRGGNGQKDVITSLFPVSPPPILRPVPQPEEPQPYDPTDPTKPGQRILFADATTLTNGGCHFAENDTATYMVASNQSLIYGINKKTGSFSIDSTAILCTPVQMVTSAGCLKDGRLLIYQTKAGVFDVFNRQVLLKEEDSYNNHYMAVNPITDRVYIYCKGKMDEYDSQMHLIKSYDCPLEGNEFKRIHVGRDGRLWIEIGRGYWTQAYTTFMNGRFTEIIQPEQQSCLSLACPYIGTSFLSLCANGLYEAKANQAPVPLFEAQWRVAHGAAMNSKNELFVMHDNRVLERFTTKGSVQQAQEYKLDLRFEKKGMFLMQGIYIDALDNLWINTGKDIYVWHPSGKINGYGSFCGKVTFAFE